MRLILSCSALLLIFGFVMLASASSNLGQARFGDSAYYLKHQLLYGGTIGIVGFLTGFFVPFAFWRKWAAVLMGIGLVSLLLVFTPLGSEAGGADRWLGFGPASFQPSEVMKLILVLYLAAWLAGRGERASHFFRGFLPLLALLGLVAFLILRQPATSTALILLTAAGVMYFTGGARLRYVMGAALVGAALFGAAVVSTPYRLARVTSFLNPGADPERSGYQLIQSKLAIEAGGLWGAGYGNSVSKLHALPEPIGDSIFAVIAEELGFAGVAALLLVFALLVIKIFLEARRQAHGKFGQLVLVGFGAIIGLQVLVHVGSLSGLIPLTGVPLPFVSFGGTALATFMTMIGIAGNITKA